MTGKADREPLNYRRVGEPILDESAVSRVLEYVDLPLQEGVSRLAFDAQLGALISQALWHSFGGRPREARAEIRRLRKWIQDYFRLRHRLRELGLDPPDPPGRWQASMVVWLQKQEQILDTRSQGGRYADAVRGFLLPRLLGLFQAAFGQAPTSTTSRHGGKDGPAARFIGKVISEVRATLEQTGFDTAVYGVDRQAELTKQWSVGSAEVLEQMIRRGINLVRPVAQPDEAMGISFMPEQLEWEVWATFYEAQLIASPQF